jgi:hypothetical protein
MTRDLWKGDEVRGMDVGMVAVAGTRLGFPEAGPVKQAWCDLTAAPRAVR